MKFIALVILVCVASCLASLPARANPAAMFFAEYLGGKLIDGVWHVSTGKPDVELLAGRISQMEAAVGPHSESGVLLRELREKVDASISREEFEREARITLHAIEDIQARVADLEMRVERLEVAQKSQSLAEDAAHFTSRALSFEQQGNIARAMANVNVALTIDPRSVDAHRQRVAIYKRQRNWGFVASSAAFALQCLDGKSSAEEFLAARAEARHAYNDFNAAIDDYTTLIKEHADNALYHLRRGSSYYDRATGEDDWDNLSQAARDLTQSIKLDPRSASAYDLRARAVYKLTRHSTFRQSRVDRLSQVIGEPPPFPLDDWRKAIELRPDDPAVLFRFVIAEQWYLLSDLTEDIGDLFKPGNSPAQRVQRDPELRARVEALLHDATRLISLDPENSEAYAARRMCHELLGHEELAEQDRLKGNELREAQEAAQ